MAIISITPEIAIDDLKTYAGGLGVLEGDKLITAGEIGLDYWVLTLFYRHGYVKLRFDGVEPVPEPESMDPKAISKLKPWPEFSVTLKGEEVIVKPYLYEYKTAKAVFFEAVCPQWARQLTDRVYMNDTLESQFLAYALLAKSSSYFIKNFIGLENVRIIDLEEAHTALLLMAMNSIDDKARIIIHTPGPWGHPSFPGSLIAREFGLFLGDNIMLTDYALARLRKGIVVSKKQESVIGRIFTKYRDKIVSITNGISLERWMDVRLLTAYRNGKITRELVVSVKNDNREKLASFLKSYKNDLDIGDKPIIAWPRRLARYKRPYFISRFIEENPDIRAVFVLAGKPHPKDFDGLNYARKFRDLHLKLKHVVYIHDYDVPIANLILRGSTFLLFTPFSGWEASGTSFMKSLVNATPVLSSRDGAAIEVIEENVTGWFFGEDIRDFINIYDDPRAKEVDERDYSEFKKKLLELIDIYYNDREKYWDIALNDVIKTPGKVDMRVVLHKYYFEGV
ncbi:glycogen/starch/alpha-glucan phosphorylase [Thermogladius sp. 4427co]|uniref:glycogen/starch/alpha-glucan phosphorylase n=1 Tax=Thermogladius sp. 4427co TaxID=3450718 RepID=UPI003F7995C6